MAKPIFGPGDDVENPNGIRVISIERANAKLSSLGIDAETPNLIEALNRRCDDFKNALQTATQTFGRDRLFWREQTDLREKRLQELERDIQRLEADNAEIHPKENLARAVKAEKEKTDLQRRLNNAVDRNIELERMLEEAPALVGESYHGPWWENAASKKDTHTAKLVDIKPIESKP